MTEKIYLCLLILCGLLCQEIPGVFSKNIDDSNPLVRKKRVINLEPGGDIPVGTTHAPFVVNIRESSRNLTVCVGAILSKFTVITVASCTIQYQASYLKITSGSIYSFRGGEFHDVISVIMRTGSHSDRNIDGVALLTVAPGFTYNRKTAAIALHQAPLLPGMLATVYGWGCNPTQPRGTTHRYALRSIKVPIMRHQDCVHAYREHTVISEHDICTFDSYKRCGHTDAGAPLVLDNQLAGLHLWRATTPGHINPDVFVLLQSLEYSSWIRNNTVHNLH